MKDAHFDAPWKRAGVFFVVAGYLYFIFEYIYLAVPTEFTMRATNLSPHLNKGMEFVLHLFINVDLHPKLGGLLFFFLVSLVPTVVFMLTDWLLERYFDKRGLESLRKKRFYSACGILLLFLFFFGPAYLTS